MELNKPTGETMSEGSDIPPARETVQVPLSALGGAQPGDKVSFVVESVDGDMATLSRGETESEEIEPGASTIDKAAGLFAGEES